MDERAISFASFRLLPSQRLLLEGDQPVRLGSRALDVLTVLAENAGRVVLKEELIARVWPKVLVEEGNLEIQVSALRRALGDGRGGNRYIVTIPGRGYEFVVPVGLTAEPTTRPVLAVPQPGTHNLPLAVTRMIGRDETVTALISRLSRQRLVTVVGPGSIGKTTVALVVAERMSGDYEHGVWLVDLAPLGDPRLVPSAVATVLGLEIHTENPLPGLIAALRDKRMLLLLDNCEHVIDAAASLAAAVLGGTPGVNILATSRELLGVTGERGYRLGPLGSPQPLSGSSAAEAAAFPAVQLFVERVAAIVEDFALTDANAPLIAEICRRLDGLPLAIEFAAPRVEVFGVEGLAAGLDRSLPLLTARRRTAMPRHRTMRAVLDWSYGLLSEDEQRFFRALGIFAGGFTVEAAAAVAIDAADTPGEAIDRLADLVAKSLVVADVGGARPRFRLLDTTRAYAIEQAAGSGESERIARGHAEYYRRLFAEGEAPVRPADEWLADYAPEIDNVRAALDWSFSPAGDSAVGIDLTAAYAPVWLNLSLMVECRERCECALLDFERDATPNPQTQMWLQIALGTSLIDTMGHVEQARALLTEALETADMLDDLDAQARALTGLMTASLYHGLHGRARTAVKRFGEIAERLSDPAVTLAAYRLMATMLLTIGRFPEAQHALGRVLQSRDPPQNRGRAPWYTTGHRASDRAMLSRALWLRGFVEKAHHEAQASLDELGPTDPQLLICRVLYVGICRLAPMTGDFAAAEQANARLIEVATSLNAQRWQTVGRFLEGKLMVERRDFAKGLGALRDAFETCRQTGWLLSYPEYKCWLAEALAGLGQLDEALDAVREGLEGSDQGEEGQRWYVPELLRIKGEVLLQQAVDRSVSLAENCFAQAGEVAREQGALFWELRVALSVARLRMTQGRNNEARQVLAPVYERFTEGFGTGDMLSARQLLESLS